MSTKIGNLSELKPHASSQEKISEGVLGFAPQFNVGRLMKPLSSFKTKGISLKNVLTALILCRFRGLSIYAFRKSGLCQMDENTIYRMMNHPFMDWRGILLKMAAQFLKIVSAHGQAGDGVRCFVIDDTEISKTGSTIEGISKIFCHVTQSYHLGFKMLVLALWDGKSLLPVDFSLHRESRKKKNYGLTDKQRKKQFRKERPLGSPAWERHKELDQEKTTVALEMLRRACRHSILAAYVLMDSWFVNDVMLQEIRRIRKGMLHVVGLCKMDIRKFMVDGHELKSEAIIKKVGSCKGARHKSRVYKSEYITVDALYKGMPVRLFYIRYRAGDWKLLLTTDTSLSFVQAMKLYHIRWSIEVMFKECKQYLRLGQGQNTDFDGQIADATITLVTHIILSLQRRFHAYETMGGLFRQVQSQMIEDTLNERIMQVVLRIIDQLLDFLCIDVDLTIAMLIRYDNTEDIVSLLCAVNEMRTINIKNKRVA